MSNNIKNNLIERLGRTWNNSGDLKQGFVHVQGDSLFIMLASEIARSAACGANQDLTILVDANTAQQVGAVHGLQAVAGKIFVLGQSPEGWASSPNVNECIPTECLTPNDRFLVAVSPSIHLAIVGHRVSEEPDEEVEAFEGGWSAKGSHVSLIARALLQALGQDPLTISSLQNLDDASELSLDCAMRLTGLLTQQLTAIQRNMAKDKDDLVSVLNILKAISAKRRAHDILFVFVDQIAQVVNMARCSIVRVWGHETSGHVLASHEDADVHDIKIDLDKYPEIHRSMESGRKVVVNDVQNDPLTKHFSEQFDQAGIASLLVIPIVLFDQNVGSFFLRAARQDGMFSLREISFCEIVAEAAANALERAHLFESIQKANERLEYLAVTDGLTGLFNHRHFRERLEDEFERARRYALPLACLIMDIDNFKRVNDTHGHLAGDSVLREMAARTLQTVRKSDIVARYGGEEFVVIMPQTDVEGAKSQAERTRQCIADSPFRGLPPGERCTVSIGVAILDHQNMLDCEGLIRVADSALYESKKNGKNLVTIGDMEGETT